MDNEPPSHAETLRKKSVRFLYSLIQPKSTNKDIARREFILNIIILGSLCLSIAANAYLLWEELTAGVDDRERASFVITSLVLLLFISLYWAARSGRLLLASFVLIGTYYFFVTYTLVKWGADAPIGLLLYAMVIVIAGILISTRFAFLIALLISVTEFINGYLQINSVFQPGTAWKTEPVLLLDITIFVVIFFIIVTLSWLSNREIERSLKRARQSEADLRKERDLLEIKVEERTRKLKQAQIEKVRQLYRFSEFGRLSSGLFHDLTNYLSALTLNLEKLGISPEKEDQQLTPYLKNVLQTRDRLENFIDAVRKQFRHKAVSSRFSLITETNQVLQILAYKARKQSVEFKFIHPREVTTWGSNLKFHHVMTNLISNAIDAYEDVEIPSSDKDKRPRKIVIKIRQKNDRVRISVRDWGIGIPQKHQTEIFDPLFTTKSQDKGTGIGLSASREIVRKEFQGTLNLKSRPNQGTIFVLEFPLKAKSKTNPDEFTPKADQPNSAAPEKGDPIS